MIRTSVLLLLLVVTVPVGGAEPADAPTASLVVRGGRVWTADPQRPWAEAVAVAGDEVLAVGSEALLRPLIAGDTQIIDARGGLVTPGWIDSHVHLLQGGLNLQSVQLRGAKSREEFAERLATYASTRPAGEWITGGDWDHTVWGGALPHRDWIDAVTPHNPVWVQRLDGHMALANSLALERAGVDESTPQPDGGAIVRDDDGRPTGLLRDNAMALVEQVRPAASTSQQLKALAAATDYLHAQGVTSIGHMGSWRELQLLRAVHQQRQLHIRVYAAAPLAKWQVVREAVESYGHGDSWLRLGGLKGFVDGSLGSHTAAFLEPYTDAPQDRGLLVNPIGDIYAWTSAADQAGLQVMVHAIGDRAIRLQLDVFQRVARENGPRDRRFRIEHAQHIHPDDMGRFAELGVIASMQPYHVIDDGRWAEPLINSFRSKTSYAFRALLDSGARLAFGSDWFVAPATPIEGIYAAATRRTLDGQHPEGWIPQQRITVEEALRAYTTDAAYAEFTEKSKGMLAPKMLADIVVINCDLTQIDPTEIRNAEVRYTILGGKVVYSNE